MPRLHLTLAILIAFASLSLAAAEDPKLPLTLSTPGDLLFADDFDDTEEIRPEWVPLHGTQWSIVDGTLRGQPSTEEFQAKRIAQGNKAHSGGTPSSRLMIPVDDCILQFRFKLSDTLNGAHFGFNDGSFTTGTGHVCRVTTSTKTGITLQKDENAKIDDDDDETLATDEFNLQPDTWYWIVLEIVGDRMAVQISDGGPTLTAQHLRFDNPKDQINLPTRGGGTIYYDTVRVWSALPKKAKS
jgi:hypothetical protein